MLKTLSDVAPPLRELAQQQVGDQGRHAQQLASSRGITGLQGLSWQALPTRRSVPPLRASNAPAHAPPSLQAPHRKDLLPLCAAIPASLPRLAEHSLPGLAERGLKPMPRGVENMADDPSLANPLARLTRLGTGWMGVIFEYEGVVLEENSELHAKAWCQLAVEEGKPRPLQWILKKAYGMKNEQVVQELLCWTRNPLEVRRISARKEAVHAELQGPHLPPTAPGLPQLLATLHKHNVPTALTSSAPEARVKPALQASGLASHLDVVITGDDVYRGRPDPEGYLVAAQQLGRPPMRCLVVGTSNQSIEAAREAGMASVVVAGRQPLYELGAADLVVRQLSDLSLVNLKQLFREEATVDPQPQPEMEAEAEAEPWAKPLAFDDF